MSLFSFYSFLSFKNNIKISTFKLKALEEELSLYEHISSHHNYICNEFCQIWELPFLSEIKINIYNMLFFFIFNLFSLFLTRFLKCNWNINLYTIFLFLMDLFSSYSTHRDSFRFKECKSKFVNVSKNMLFFKWRCGRKKEEFFRLFRMFSVFSSLLKSISLSHCTT